MFVPCGNKALAQIALLLNNHQDESATLVSLYVHCSFLRLDLVQE